MVQIFIVVADMGVVPKKMNELIYARYTCSVLYLNIQVEDTVIECTY